MTQLSSRSDVQVAQIARVAIDEIKRRELLLPTYVRFADNIVEQASRIAADRLAEADLAMNGDWAKVLEAF